MRNQVNKILIRVDGYKNLGMGHLYEMLTLSKYMRDEYDFKAVFVTRNNKAAIDLIEKNNFELIPLKFNISYQDELAVLKQLITIEKPRAALVDLIKVFNKTALIKVLKSENTCVAIFTNDHTQNDIQSDMVFNPSILQERENYEHFGENKYYLGFDYVLMPLEYAAIPKEIVVNGRVKRVMICMGGSDHNNLTFSILKAIDKSTYEFCIDIVLNSSFFQKEKVDGFVRKLKHQTSVHYDLNGILKMLLQSDLAITAGGNTHIERMCAGVPGIVITQLIHQEISANRIAEFGATINLGMYNRVNPRQILEAFHMLLENKEMRENLCKKGRELVDGQGLLRVSKVIAERITGVAKLNLN